MEETGAKAVRQSPQGLAVGRERRTATHERSPPLVIDHRPSRIGMEDLSYDIRTVSNEVLNAVSDKRQVKMVTRLSSSGEIWNSVMRSKEVREHLINHFTGTTDTINSLPEASSVSVDSPQTLGGDRQLALREEIVNDAIVCVPSNLELGEAFSALKNVRARGQDTIQDIISEAILIFHKLLDSKPFMKHVYGFVKSNWPLLIELALFMIKARKNCKNKGSIERDGLVNSFGESAKEMMTKLIVWIMKYVNQNLMNDEMDEDYSREALKSSLLPTIVVYISVIIIRLSKRLGHEQNAEDPPSSSITLID